MLKLIKILFLLVSFWLPLNAYSQDSSGNRAETFIEILSSEALKLATDKSLTKQVRQAKISILLNDGFDMPWIARFVLGHNWRLATPSQQKEYLSLFKAIIEHTYSRQFQDYSDQKIVIKGHKLGNRKYIFVSSIIFDPTRSNVNIDVNWRIVPAGNSFKIVDVVIEGVSMGVTQRNEYASVLKRNGNNMAALIEAMRRSLTRLEKID
jgi:phospholipid transport system substrate-binding protein